MSRLAKNLILTTALVSAIFIVDLSSAEAVSSQEKNYPPCTVGIELQYMDFWGKFRDTVMPDPDTPQNNNPPREAEKPKPVKPKPVPPPSEVKPKPVD